MSRIINVNKENLNLWISNIMKIVKEKKIPRNNKLSKGKILS